MESAKPIRRIPYWPKHISRRFALTESSKSPVKQAAALLMFAMLLVPALALILTTQSEVVSASPDPDNWWNDNWTKRRPITIENAPVYDNYVVRIEVDYDNDMAFENFQDIRFVDNDNTELSFWIENYNTAENAIVWVKIPHEASSTWTRLDNAILEVGSGDNWDSADIIFPFVTKFENDDNYYMYYSGIKTGSYHKIGVAISTDGENFTKYENNPILDKGATGKFDEQRVWCPRVILENDNYFMFYTGRDSADEEEIGLAMSSNPLGPFTRYSTDPVIPHGGDGSWNSKWTCHVSIPVWDNDNNGWVILSSGGSGTNEDIGRWTSDNLYSWTEYENNPVIVHNTQACDAYHAYHPSIYPEKNDNKWVVYYSAAPGADINRDIAYATSTDLINFTKYVDNPIFANDGTGFDSGEVLTPQINFKIDNEYHMYYVGGNGTRAIGLARSSQLTFEEEIETQSIYVYYGNASAENVSTIYISDILADDFERAVGGAVGGGWTENNETLEIVANPSGSGNVFKGYNTTDNPYIWQSFTQTKNLQILCKKYAGTGAHLGVDIWEGSTEIATLGRDTDDHLYDTYSGSSHDLGAMPINSWYRLRIVIRSNNTHDTYVDDVLKTDNQPTRDNMTNGIDNAHVQTYVPTAGHVDDFVIFKYIDPEPTCTVGEEESYEVAQWNLIETWTGSVEAVAQWNLVETWAGEIEAHGWVLVETWTGTVEAPSAWQLIEEWTGTVEAPVAWVLIETWTGTVEAYSGWVLLETWAGSVEAFAQWQLIETWDGTIRTPSVPMWHLIETWNGTVETQAGWVLIETWSGTIQSPVEWLLVETWTGATSAPSAWQLVESWNGTVEAFAKWDLVETWEGSVRTVAQWGLVESWDGTIIAPVAWGLIETWEGTVEAFVSWQLIESWGGNVQAPAGWLLAESWSGTILAYAEWSEVESWTGTVYAVGWRLIEAWDGTVHGVGWRPIETWTGSVRTLALYQVSVSITPDNQSGTLGDTLTYTVIVVNIGGTIDNYDLASSDAQGWTTYLDNDNFLNVPSGENRETTLNVGLSTTGTHEVIVTATGTGVSDSDNCTAISATAPEVVQIGDGNLALAIGLMAIGMAVCALLIAMLLIRKRREEEGTT